MQSQAMPATTSDASNNKRCHIVFSFSITEHRGIHLANCLIMPPIMRDGRNYTRCQQPRATAANTGDTSNHGRRQYPRATAATTGDNSDASNHDQRQLTLAMPAITRDASNCAHIDTRSQQSHTMPATTGDSSTMPTGDGNYGRCQ